MLDLWKTNHKIKGDKTDTMPNKEILSNCICNEHEHTHTTKLLPLLIKLENSEPCYYFLYYIFFKNYFKFLHSITDIAIGLDIDSKFLLVYV